MTTPVQIRRDPFARASLMRRVVHHRYAGAGTVHSCAWCGATDTDKTLYSYWWETDSLMQPSNRGTFGREFCSVSCYEAFNS